MMRKLHIVSVSRSPRQAQTVQQLKYDTLLVYLNNGVSLIFGMITNLAETTNSLQSFPGTLPYKGYFGGGGGSTTS